MKTDLVVAGFLIHNGKLLLIHHRKLDIWIPLGGHIDEDETPDQALKREFKEELNLDIEILNFNHITNKGFVRKELAVPFYVNVHSVGDHDHCCFYYLCKLKSENIVVNEKELKGFEWFTVEELNQEHVPEDVKEIALKAFEMFEV